MLNLSGLWWFTKAPRLPKSRAQDILHFDQVEEGFGSQQEGSRNDEAPLPPGANPTWKRQLETFDQMMIPGPWAVLG